jgi:hypothetical protein
MLEEGIVAPQPLFAAVWGENGHFLSDRLRFDEQNFEFMGRLVELGESFDSRGSHGLRALRVSLNFFLETLAHAKVKTERELWCGRIVRLIQEVEGGAQLVLERVLLDKGCVLDGILIRCFSVETRAAFAGIIVAAFRRARDVEKDENAIPVGQ